MAATVITVSKLADDINHLHGRCNSLRRALGHAPQPAADVAALKQQHARPEGVLLQLRDAKASELQLLALRCCGHSTRQCHTGAKQPGDRFNLALLLAVADCMAQQKAAISGYEQRHEALQRENRTLRQYHSKDGGAFDQAACVLQTEYLSNHVVYEACFDGRHVALKEYRTDERSLSRCYKEALVLRRLRHPGIVEIEAKLLGPGGRSTGMQIPRMGVDAFFAKYKPVEVRKAPAVLSRVSL